MQCEEIIEVLDVYKRQVFALIVGIILAKLGERTETVGNFFSQFNDIMMEMTMIDVYKRQV